MPPKILFTQVPTAALSASGIRVEVGSLPLSLQHKLPFALFCLLYYTTAFPQLQQKSAAKGCGFFNRLVLVENLEDGVKRIFFIIGEKIVIHRIRHLNLE